MSNNLLELDPVEVQRTIESATLRFQARLMKIDDLAAYLSCSRNYARKLAEYAGAVRRLGSSWLADRLVIDRYLLEHVRQIKQRCDTRQWPLEFMNIVCMGGTARLLKNEIYQVFGEETFIPEAPEFVNVKGFLKKMCADDGIDLTQTVQTGGKSA